VRAEVGLRGHIPVFTDSILELPSPRGIGFTVGLGIEY
jgi:hypothetical protein